MAVLRVFASESVCVKVGTKLLYCLDGVQADAAVAGRGVHGRGGWVATQRSLMWRGLPVLPRRDASRHGLS